MGIFEGILAAGIAIAEQASIESQLRNNASRIMQDGEYDGVTLEKSGYRVTARKGTSDPLVTNVRHSGISTGDGLTCNGYWLFNKASQRLGTRWTVSATVCNRSHVIEIDPTQIRFKARTGSYSYSAIGKVEFIDRYGLRVDIRSSTRNMPVEVRLTSIDGSVCRYPINTRLDDMDFGVFGTLQWPSYAELLVEALKNSMAFN